MTCARCPRRCGVDRDRSPGFCGETNAVRVALVDGQPYMLHRFEEPVISGTRGSGAVFFSGCNLRCVYCQNAAISRGQGETVTLSVDELAELFERAAAAGDSLSLVTAAHFVDVVAAALKTVKPRLRVPVVYNSSGYESVDGLRLLDGLVDVYLPDCKHVDPARAARYAGAPDYPQTALAAIAEMVRQAGEPVVENGIMQKGVLIRHLVLPNGRKESIDVMRTLAARFPTALVSVMRQYTPAFCPEGYPEIGRKVTSFEYASVVNVAAELGLHGFMQEKGCATQAFTPHFG